MNKHTIYSDRQSQNKDLQLLSSIYSKDSRLKRSNPSLQDTLQNINVFLKRKKKILPRQDPIQSEIFIDWGSNNNILLNQSNERQIKRKKELMLKYGPKDSNYIKQIDELQVNKLQKRKQRSLKNPSKAVSLPKINKKEKINNNYYSNSERYQTVEIMTDGNNSYRSDSYFRDSSLRNKAKTLPDTTARSAQQKALEQMLKSQKQKQHWTGRNSEKKRAVDIKSEPKIQKKEPDLGKNIKNLRYKKNKKQWIEINPLKLQTYYYKLSKQQEKTESNILNASMMQLKKNTIFLPDKEQTAEFIKKYKSMNKNYSLDDLIRSENFTVKRCEDHLYFGQQVQEKYQGFGIMVKNKSIFQGQWKNNQKKFGHEKIQSGIYYGQFSNDKRNGKGQFFWNNGQYYQGQWKNGQKHGNGLWKTEKGDSYLGQWRNGKVNGFGIHVTSSGQRYEGQFKDFLKNGQGKQSFPNGDSFQGQFENGHPNGKGLYTWKVGATYNGDFVKGFRQGKGCLNVDNGLVYFGQFVQQFPNGFAQLRLSNGDVYKGNFKDGLKQGKGIYNAVSQHKIYKGYFVKDKFKESIPQLK